MPANVYSINVTPYLGAHGGIQLRGPNKVKLYHRSVCSLDRGGPAFLPTVEAASEATDGDELQNVQGFTFQSLVKKKKIVFKNVSAQKTWSQKRQMLDFNLSCAVRKDFSFFLFFPESQLAPSHTIHQMDVSLKCHLL